MAKSASKAPKLTDFRNWLPPNDLCDMKVYFDALAEMQCSLLGIINQPRAEHLERELSAWHNTFSGLREKIAQSAEALAPTNISEAEAKASILISWEIACECNPANLARLAGQFAAEAARTN